MALAKIGKYLVITTLVVGFSAMNMLAANYAEDEVMSSQNQRTQFDKQLIQDFKNFFNGASIDETIPESTHLLFLLHHRNDERMRVYPHPLGYAIEKGRVEFVPLLLELGQKVNEDRVIGSKGFYERVETSLMYAVRGGHVETAKILLDAGADPNAVNEIFRSVLMIAIQASLHEDRKIQMIHLLLARGAQIDEKIGSFGRTAIDVAEALDDIKILEILRNKNESHSTQRIEEPKKDSLSSGILFSHPIPNNYYVPFYRVSTYRMSTYFPVLTYYWDFLYHDPACFTAVTYLPVFIYYPFRLFISSFRLGHGNSSL